MDRKKIATYIYMYVEKDIIGKIERYTWIDKYVDL